MLLIALLLLQADPCSWLTPDQITKEMHSNPYRAAQKSVAIHVYKGQNDGTRCTFSGGGPDVSLTVYVDRSPAEAKQTFDGLMGTYFQPTSKPTGLGDEAYFDTHHGLHVLKGNTRLFIAVTISSGPTSEQHALNFAKMVVPKA